MSTNYYWMYDEPKTQYIVLPTGEQLKCHDTEIPYQGTHVGKRTAGRSGMVFIFCAEPAIVLEALKSKINFRADELIVEDEYGRQFTAKDFSILLYDTYAWEVHSIGEYFC